MSYLEEYKKWMNSSFIDEATKNELKSIENNEKEIEDRFYKNLEFGTAGLRGVIGAGTNRMNIYTVSKATQGYAQYLNNHFENPTVAIAYDSRNMSREFAKATALTFAANNIKVYLFEDLRPTPMLSFTVRELKCQGGVVITASHNPKQYNGYKVYGEDGGQITDETANEVIGYINNLDIFKDVKTISEEEAVSKGLLKYIGEDIDKVYIEKVKSLSLRKELIQEKAKDLNIIYTPIHGSGLMPIKRILTELGFENLNIVKEQEKPDGNFPTASYPNPEDKSVFNIALEMALYYKEEGLTLYEALIKLYEEYGFTQEELISIELQGKEGQEKIANCLDTLRKDKLIELNGVKVVKAFDYKLSEEITYGSETIVSTIKLPKSNVLKYILEDDSWFVVRPSGTEPKMKIYLSVVGKSLEDSEEKLNNFKNIVMEKINNILY